MGKRHQAGSAIDAEIVVWRPEAVGAGSERRCAFAPENLKQRLHHLHRPHGTAKVALNEGPHMKRVRIAPGKFVTISTELSEKAARVFASGLTRNQVRDLKASEPRRATGLIAGSAKPLALARRKRAVATVARKISSTAPGFLRRSTG